MSKSLLLLSLLAALSGPYDANAQPVEVPSVRDISVRSDGEWIEARQGRDETGQVVRVAIWGRLREPPFFEEGFRQIDDDPEEEYVVISRNEGTGPYYRLQIIDFVRGGILTWSYASFGPPRLEEAEILLGRGEYQDAASVPEYDAYSYTSGGLKPRE